MSNLPTALDALLMKQVQSAGSLLPTRPAINFLNATVVDNPTNNSTDVTTTGGGSTTFGQSNITLSNNGLSSNVATEGLQTLRIGGPTAPYWIGGLTPPTSGKLATLIIIDTTGQLMGVLANDAASTSGWRINFDGASTGQVLFTQHRPGAKLLLQYDFQALVWQVVNTGPQTTHLCEVSVCDFGAYGDATHNDAAAIQAAVNFVADNPQFELIFPANKTFVIQSPIQIPTANIVIRSEVVNSVSRGSSPSTTIHQVYYLGEAFNVTPLLTPSPPITTYAAGTGTVYFANFQETAAGFPQLFLTENESGNINGFAGFTFGCWVEQTGTPGNYSFIAGSSGGDGQNYGMAFALFFNNAGTGTLSVYLTTTGSGLVGFNATTNITGAAKSYVSVQYDGAELRLFIDGSPAGSTAATGTIVQQGFEDFTIGAGNIPSDIGSPNGQYPFAPIVTSQATQVTGIANVCIWKSAVYFGGSSSGYGPITSELYGGDFSTYTSNTLSSSFATTLGATIPGCGVTSNPSVVIAIGYTSAISTWGPVSNLSPVPIYLNWVGTYATQGAGITIRGLGFTSQLSGSGIRMNLAPSAHIEKCWFSGLGRGISLLNNCYTSITRDCQASMQAIGSAQSWAWCGAGPGTNQMTVDDFNIDTCGAYGIVFSGAAGLARNCYIVANSSGTNAGILLHQADGAFHLDGITVSDEGGAFGKGAIILDAASTLPQLSTITMTACDVATTNSSPALMLNNYGEKLTLTSKGCSLQSGGTDLIVIAGANNLKILFDDLAQAMTFSAAGTIPRFKIDAYEVQTLVENFTSNAALTLSQDAWLHGIQNYTDTHPYLTGTTAVNIPFLFDGQRVVLVNGTAQTLTFKWTGGTGSTGVSLTSGSSGYYRSDGTNLYLIQ